MFFRHGIRGQGNNRNVALSVFGLANLLCRATSIHDWHIAIHQHEIICFTDDGFHGFFSIGGHCDVASQLFQHSDSDFLIHDIIFGQKDTQGRTSADVGGGRLR